MFVYREVRGLHQAAYILALFAVGSQLLAIVRDRLLAHTFGAGVELDLYYAAFRVPDLLFVLFASVLSIYILLPFVNRYAETDSPTAGVSVLSQVFTLFLVLYTVMAAVLALAAPWYAPLLFPGFVGHYGVLVALLQILLLQPLLLGISNLCGVVTQMNHRFILYALSPLFYNVGIIIGIVLLYPLMGLSGLAWGVVLGALGHLCIQLPFVVRSEYSFSVTRQIDWALIRQVLFVSVPRALTLSVNQIVLLVLVSMASLMASGSVSVFQFAYNLQSVPLAIVGMSYSVAAFPTLSHLYVKNKRREFNRQLLTALRHIVFWSLPIIGLVVVLRAQIVRVLLGSGEFDWADTRLTAAILAIFVVSLVAQAILLLLIRAFYAGGKTVVPLLVAFGSGAVSLALAAWLHVVYLAHPALHTALVSVLRLHEVTGTEVLILVLAFVVGQFIQLFVLVILSSRAFHINYKPLGNTLLQALVAAVAGAGGAYGALSFFVSGVQQDTFLGILLQGSLAGVVGIVVVVLTYTVSGSQELRELYRSFQGKILKTDVVAPQE